MRCFFVGSTLRIYNEDTRPAKGVQLRDIRRRVTTLVREAEESPLLETVARERLLKSQQAEKKP
jgi:hypothetical protein